MTGYRPYGNVVLYFYDAASDSWWSIDNPLPDHIVEPLLAANRAPGCVCVDADIEYGWRATAPDVAIVHEWDCAS